MHSVHICKVCGKVKNFGTYIEVPRQLQRAIDRGEINVETVVCPDCDVGQK